MKTTLDLPDELLRAVKIRAVEENRRIKDVVADLLAKGLAAKDDRSHVQRRVELPLVHCAHPAADGEQLTPARVAELLSEQDAASLRP